MADTIAEPKARVSRIAAARLFNIGNYEHFRIEATIELQPDADPAVVIENVTALMESLRPETPEERDSKEWIASQLARPLGEIPAYEVERLKGEKERSDARDLKRAAALASLEDLGAKVVSGPAPEPPADVEVITTPEQAAP